MSALLLLIVGSVAAVRCVLTAPCFAQYVELVSKQQPTWKELAGYKEDKPAQAKL